MDKLEAYLPSSAGSRTSKPLRHFCHALPIEVNFADTFDAREHVIHRLAADAHQFRTHDACHEIARQIENFLRSRPFEAFAKDRGHRAGKRLHFGAKRHAEVCLALFIDLQINTNRISAFLIFSYVDKIEPLAFARFLLLRVVRVRDERLAPLIFRKRFEEIDDLV